jgi:pimeloyl-ACP methyl ester carboxylesterase
MIASGARQVLLGDGNVTEVEQWGESGPILLCVHGITSSRKMWQRTADRFSSTFRVVAYDQRGHGDSTGVDGPMTLERSLADLDAIATQLEGPIRGLIGHSWGGAVAILGGLRIRAERVIAIDPMVHQAPGMWNADFVDDLRDVLAIPSDQREPAIREMFAGAPAVEIDAKVHAMGSMRLATIEALGAENDADRGGWDLRDRLRDYPKPLLLAVADPSESVISAEDLAFIRAAGGPRVTIEVFEGEGHTLQRTAFEKYAAAVERFLAEPSRGRNRDVRPSDQRPRPW